MRWGVSCHAPLLGVSTSHLAQVFIPQPTLTPSLVCLGQGNVLWRLAGPAEGEVDLSSWGEQVCPLLVLAKHANAVSGSGDKLCRYTVHKSCAKRSLPSPLLTLYGDREEVSQQGPQVPLPSIPLAPLLRSLPLLLRI